MKVILFGILISLSTTVFSAPVLISYNIEGDVSPQGPGSSGCTSSMCKFFVKPNSDTPTDVKIIATIDYQYVERFWVREQIVGVESINVSFVGPEKTITLDDYAQAVYKKYPPGIYTLIFTGTLLGLDSWAGFATYESYSMVPIPAALYLFTPALVGLIGFRQKWLNARLASQ